jgi:hypothetical protein
MSEDLEALVAQQRLHFDRFNERRHWEWRVTFTFWGGLAVAANALRGAHDLPVGVYVIGVLAAGVVHFLFEFRYIEPQAMANHRLSLEFTQEIERRIGFEVTGNPEYNRFAHYWQVLVTLLFGVVVGVAIYWGRSPS